MRSLMPCATCKSELHEHQDLWVWRLCNAGLTGILNIPLDVLYILAFCIEWSPLQTHLRDIAVDSLFFENYLRSSCAAIIHLSACERISHLLQQQVETLYCAIQTDGTSLPVPYFMCTLLCDKKSSDWLASLLTSGAKFWHESLSLSTGMVQCADCCSKGDQPWQCYILDSCTAKEGLSSSLPKIQVQLVPPLHAALLPAMATHPLASDLPASA